MCSTIPYFAYNWDISREMKPNLYNLSNIYVSFFYESSLETVCDLT